MRLQLLNLHLHGEHEFGIISKFCDRNKLALDVGAADGLYTYQLAKHSLSCVSFEPNPVSYERLKRRFAHLQVLNCALSNRPGSAELRVPTVDGANYASFGTIEPENRLRDFRGRPHRTFTIPVKTLDSFDFDNVGIIKIDVEGHEWEVVRGGASTIEKSRPNLMIEIEERHNAGNLTRLVEFFGARGYGVFFLWRGWLRPIAAFDLATMQDASGEIRPGKYYNNFLFLSDPGAYGGYVQE